MEQITNDEQVTNLIHAITKLVGELEVTNLEESHLEEVKKISEKLQNLLLNQDQFLVNEISDFLGSNITYKKLLEELERYTVCHNNITRVDAEYGLAKQKMTDVNLELNDINNQLKNTGLSLEEVQDLYSTQTTLEIVKKTLSIDLNNKEFECEKIKAIDHGFKFDVYTKQVYRELAQMLEVKIMSIVQSYIKLATYCNNKSSLHKLGKEELVLSCASIELSDVVQKRLSILLPINPDWHI